MTLDRVNTGKVESSQPKRRPRLADQLLHRRFDAVPGCRQMRIVKSERHKGRRLVIKITAQQPQKPLGAIPYINVALRRVCGLLLRGAHRLAITRKCPCIPDHLAVAASRKRTDVKIFACDTIASLSHPPAVLHRRDIYAQIGSMSNLLYICEIWTSTIRRIAPAS